MILKINFYGFKNEEYDLIDTLNISFGKSINNILTLEPNKLVLSYFDYNIELFRKQLKDIFGNVDYYSIKDKELIVMIDTINDLVMMDLSLPQNFETKIDDYCSTIIKADLLRPNAAFILARYKINLLLKEHKRYLSIKLLYGIYIKTIMYNHKFEFVDEKLFLHCDKHLINY